MANNSLYSIKKVIWKITKGFEPKISIKKENDDHGFSNREEFLNEIVKYFKNEFEKKTTHRSILYPTSFLIYLHPSDYKIQEQDFRLTVKDAVEDFYNYINEKTKNVDYKPHAPYWLFQICSFNGIFVKNQVDEEIITVPKGEVYIISDTFPVDFSENNVFEGNNIKGTLRAKDSAKELAINKDLFHSIEMLAKDKWIVYWNDNDRKNGKVTNAPVSYDKGRNAENEAYAVLQCRDNFIGKDGKKGDKFFIVDKLIEISGKNDARKGSQIAKVDNVAVNISHVQIKYIQEIKKFQLAAFGPAKLNERIVKLSSISGDIHWEDLPDNSEIFINSEISITFKIK